MHYEGTRARHVGLPAANRRGSRRLAAVDQVAVRFQRPVIRPEAIALPPDPVQSLQHLRTVVREAIADVLGADAVPDAPDGFQPHISLAYASTEQPADETLRAIVRVDAEPVHLVVTAVSLIEMHRDRRMYEWQTVEAVPLGQTA
jgi:2'-5' RNA ligase